MRIKRINVPEQEQLRQRDRENSVPQQTASESR